MLWYKIILAFAFLYHLNVVAGDRQCSIEHKTCPDTEACQVRDDTVFGAKGHCINLIVCCRTYIWQVHKGEANPAFNKYSYCYHTNSVGHYFGLTPEECQAIIDKADLPPGPPSSKP